jgi:putative transposase
MKPTRVHNFETYFVTTNTWERRPLFHKAHIAKIFIETLYGHRSQGKYLLHEFVLMPEHFHLLITPHQITVERAVQFIKGDRRTASARNLAQEWRSGKEGFLITASVMRATTSRITTTFSLIPCEEVCVPHLNCIPTVRRLRVSNSTQYLSG